MEETSFPRWMLLGAAGISIAVGAFWWATTIRNETARPATLQDHGREWLVGSEVAQTLPAELPEELRAIILNTLRTGRLTIAPEIAALLENDETFARRRSARPNTFRLRSATTTALPDGRPQFRWSPVEGATAYRIEISDVAQRKSAATVEVPAPALEWSPAQALEAGVLYEWQVEALRGAAVVARAPNASAAKVCFRILSENERLEWERARGAVGESNLLRGIVAARAGLLDEAAEEFRALGRQNPRAERARLFLEQVETAGAR